MPQISAAASAVINSGPETVYSLLADYRDGHRKILPERYFQALEVERGGTGAGTRIRVQMRVLGKTRTFRAEVSEPEPGRMLAETDPESGAVTTFTVAPVDGSGARASVTIATEWTARGPAALMERLLAPPLLRRIYVEELRNLARCASTSR